MSDVDAQLAGGEQAARRSTGRGGPATWIRRNLFRTKIDGA